MHIRDITSILAYPSYPSYPDTPYTPVSAQPTVVYPNYGAVPLTTSIMPSLTTTILTSAVTLTSFVTVTTAAAMAPPSIFEQVEKLGQCSVSVPL
jgi:hypothetical protein